MSKNYEIKDNWNSITNNFVKIKNINLYINYIMHSMKGFIIYYIKKLCMITHTLYLSNSLTINLGVLRIVMSLKWGSLGRIAVR